MSIIYVLIPIAVLLTAVGIYLFFWAVKTEQFDDLEKQGMSILFDDEAESQPDAQQQAISEPLTSDQSSSEQTKNNPSTKNDTST